MEQLSKKERRELKHQEKEIAKEAAVKARRRKRLTIWSISVVLVILSIGGLIWYSATRPLLPKSEIISRNGLHWHPEISISILGRKQEIPANIGIGVVEKPIHTHDNMGVIHLEFSGLVKKDDLRLGKFFEIWGKRFNKDCVLDKCNGPEGQVKMFINGKQNFEFENYIMNDKDKIEIILE